MNIDEHLIGKNFFITKRVFQRLKQFKQDRGGSYIEILRMAVYEFMFKYDRIYEISNFKIDDYDTTYRKAIKLLALELNKSALVITSKILLDYINAKEC